MLGANEGLNGGNIDESGRGGQVGRHGKKRQEH